MTKVQQIGNECFAREAESREDQLILLILRKMNSIYTSKPLYFVEVATFPAILLILSAVVYYVLKNRLGFLFLLAPSAILAFYIPGAIQNIKNRYQNSGIKYDIKKYGEHFLITKAVCTAKNEKKGPFGKRLYNVSAKLPSGVILESIPVFAPYYESIKTGKELWLVKSSSDEAAEFFALPKYVLQSSKAQKEQDALTAVNVENLLRPVNEEDRKIALSFGNHRNRQRIKFYGRAYLVCLAFSLAFFVAAVVLFSDYINLSIVILCCLLASVAMNIIESIQFKKLILNDGARLYCLDGRVSKKAADKGKYIEIEDLSGSKVYRSTAQEDYRMFEKGCQVLLLYRDGKDKPIICMKNLPEAL